MEYLLQTKELTKVISGKTLVEKVDLHIQKGEIYGFLGPNGAGKTTIMKMITNLWKPSSGKIELFGNELKFNSYDVLKHIGSVIEFPSFYEELTGEENLKLHCEYMGFYLKGAVDKALSALELEDARKKKVGEYSLGMKQRLGIARAILPKPELLILDEPTNGLDPAGMKKVRELLGILSKEYGITVMVSSHILSEIESVATTIGILHQGKLLKEIPMKEIEEKNVAYVELTTPDVKHTSYVLSDKTVIRNFKTMDNKMIRIYDENVNTGELSKVLSANDVAIESLRQQGESLEDYYLKLTGEEK